MTCCFAPSYRYDTRICPLIPVSCIPLPRGFISDIGQSHLRKMLTTEDFYLPMPSKMDDGHPTLSPSRAG